MSRETLQWLNENTLIGFTDKRGDAWHWRQGSDNHYPGAIPVEDVRKRLLHWTAEEAPVYVGLPDRNFDGLLTTVEVPNKKAVVRSDTGKALGVFSNEYQIHQYDEWLVGNVEKILDDDLQIGSVGLLRGGGQAWVQIEVPDTVETSEGVRFRPFLLAATSLDGSLSTSYSRAVTHVVCDNTMAIALGENHDQKLRIRHSSKSLGKLQDARDALGIIYSAADDFAAQVAELTATTFTENDFRKLLDLEVKLPEDPKKAASAHKVATEKREFLFDLYRFDERVAPWTGTAFGAWQAFNTYRQHERKLKKDSIRAERNMSWVVTGQNDKIDTAVLGNIMELVA